MTLDNSGKGSVLFGIAMALDEMRLEGGLERRLDLLDAQHRLSISGRARALRRAMRAPVPAALPAEATLASSQSGMRPSTMAYFTSIWLPKAPANVIALDLRDAVAVHQQLDAGIERGLGELDGAHVVLRDGDARLALADEVGEGAAGRFDARRASGQRAVDHAVRA